MNIVSFSKATQAENQVQRFKEVVGPEAEKRFKTVQQRIDWIHDQLEKGYAEKVESMNLEEGTFQDTEYKDGIIQLREVEPGQYISKGSWTSPVIDLGEAYYQTLLYEESFNDNGVDVEKRIASGQKKEEIGEFEKIDPIAFPQNRFIQVQYIFKAEGVSETKKADFTSDMSFEEHERVIENKLNQDFVKQMNVDTSWRKEGTLLKQKIKKEDYKKIYEVEVK